MAVEASRLFVQGMNDHQANANEVGDQRRNAQCT
jgi:hypothetical protein